LFSFIKILSEQKIHLSDESLTKKDSFLKISKVTIGDLGLEFFILDKSKIAIVNIDNGEKRIVNIKNTITKDVLEVMLGKIKNSHGTFEMPNFDTIQSFLGFETVKVGKNYQKSDIVLDIENPNFKRKNEGFSIKSFLGSNPTLLNASTKTNFLYRVACLNNLDIDKINTINTRAKIRDRINHIRFLGGELKYLRVEKDTMNHNLKIIDSCMPKILGDMLLIFYEKRIYKISDVVDYLVDSTDILQTLKINNKQVLENKVKDFLVGILFGIFPGKNWDGNYESKGAIIVKKEGSLVSFHVTEIEELQNFLYKSIKFDTPSSTRHKFGTIIQKKNNKHLFKLNLQLRF
jgi:DNA (cytosine-5)-methyltransferase 1